ncbi:unnamed protein product, partial [Phaeothamnion confervicola]
MGNFTFGLLAILFAAFCSSPAFDPEVVLGSWAHDDNAEDTPVIEEPHFTRTSDFFTSEVRLVYSKKSIWNEGFRSPLPGFHPHPSNQLLTSLVTFLLAMFAQGERCHAWLYLPRGNSSTPPVVLMAQGLGAQKDFGLHMYAEVFAAAGIASYSFDYRTFGGSSGEPRNVINPWRHIKDYQAALEHVRTDGLGGRVDPERLALWGTSFSGGHVLAAAAEDAGNVTAVVSQMPHLDGRAASRRAMAQRGLLGTLRIVHAVLKDLGRSFMGLSPACLKIAGKTGELAMMTMSEEQLQKYFAKHPAEYLGGWVNLVPARAAAMIGLYSPT